MTATILLALLPLQAFAQLSPLPAARGESQGEGPRRAPAAVTATARNAAVPAAEQASSRRPVTNAAVEIPLFGPQRYVRTTGSKDVYTTKVTVPAWLTSPYRLHIQNGDLDGTNRVSSAIVEVNGVAVDLQPEFNQNVATIDRTVTLTRSTELTVTLASLPASYLTISLFGTSADTTKPALTWITPAAGSTVNSATPRLLLRYKDEPLAPETAASGVDLTTLKVFLDNTDHTSWFTRRSDEASADVPATVPLAAGLHTFRATIADHAKNVSEITGQFRVDLTPPVIAITQPAAARYLATRTPAIALTYSDDVALDLTSLHVTINGTDRTALFTKTAAGATIAWDATTLPEGSNQVVARIRDLGGNESTAAVSFFVDVTAPQLTVAQPLAGARLGAPNVAVTLTYEDNIALAPASATASVDGAAVTLTAQTGTATGTIQLTDGARVLTATVADRAGNVTTKTVAFIVDTTVPVVRVVAPAPGAIIKTSKPEVKVQYSDEQGITPSTVKIAINGTDRTSAFTIDAATAVATLTDALPEGTTTVKADAADVTGNLGSVTSTFFVDTIAPAATFSSPLDLASTNHPEVVVAFNDGTGSGVDPASVKLFVDGTDRTALVAASANGVRATLDLTPVLIDGVHQLRVDFADRAGNPATISKAFTIDTILPALEVLEPVDDSFINSTTPPIRVRYSDLGGTGVATRTLKLTLRRGDEPVIDVTGFVTVGAAEALGAIPATAPLADGTYILHAEVRDLAGNVSAADSAFEVDTVAPTYTIESPAANEYVATGRPAFGIRYTDELSGVDLTRAVVRIDGAGRTPLFTFTEGLATGVLPAGEILAEGAHTIDVRLYDRAGNLAPTTPQAFTVDTIVPTAAITAPLAGAYLAGAPYTFAVTYGDATGSGVAPATVHIAIDGVDRTAEFTVTATGATARIAPVLADGSHTVTVALTDWAGNPATATAAFKVDAVLPVVHITAPAADAWINKTTVNVAGSVTDASPVTIDINGLTTLPTADGTFSIAVPTTDGAFAIKAKATDAAGNAGTAQVSVNVDTAAPVLTITSPAAGFVTKQNTVAITGAVTDSSAVTLKLAGTPVALSGTAFATTADLPAEGASTFAFTATDAASNSTSASITVIRDTIAPQLTVASPAASSVVGTSPLVVSGTLADATATTITVNGTKATVTGDAWQASLAGLSEGAQTLTVVATDAAGNATTVTHQVTLDLKAPVVVITSPAAGTLTKDATVTITGTATDETLKTVTAAGVTATLEAGSTDREKKFTLAAVPLTNGDNTLKVVATDALSRNGEASLLVTRDSTAPSITVNAPSQITRSRGAKVTAVVTDNLAVKSVAFQLNGTDLTTLTAPPFEVTLAVPAAANVGDVLTLKVIATDTAGNATTATNTLRVAAEGAVTGQVLSDATGLPLANATVRVAGSTDRVTTTDARGRYGLAANEQTLTLLIEKADHTSVERTVAIESGTGTVPVDARLTPRGAGKAIGAGGGTIAAPGLTITVPGGAVAVTTTFSVTRLSSQGLPNLLPLGWSPRAAFDVTADGTLANVPLQASITNVTSSADLALYKPALHAWVAVTTAIAPAAGVVQTSLPEAGTYALVVRDDANVPAAVAGAPLQGVAMVAIPQNATSSGDVTPPTLPPTGGSASGRLAVHSPTALPSGTVVQAEVTETFSLATGETASEERRTQDIVLYRAGSDVAADFPIIPSRSFATGDLVEGKVHLDILAGREAVRGKTGGSQPLSLDAGAVNVTIAAGSLPQDLAISATPVVLSSYLPSTPAAIPHAEVILDFSGMTLATPAELSIAATGIAAGETVVIARVERIGGVPKVVIVAATDRVGDRFVSRALPRFSGLTTEGRYVFYRIGVPWGVVNGSATAPRTPIVAQANGFPFVAIVGGIGQFSLIAPAGSARISASVPNTPFAAETVVAVTSGGTATAGLVLGAAATTATVTPADGAIRVPTSTQIEITATAPLRASSANVSTIQLRSSSGASVSLRYVLSGSGRVLAVIPQSALAAGEKYTLTVNGLTDDYGGAVSIAPVSFTTLTVVPPTYDTEKIVFTMPDAGGMVTVSAPAGSLPAGTRILIVNSGNGVVVTYTAGNDGSFSGQFPATISDRLLVTITDPQGNVTNFERSRWVATDGSGRVAIGPAGGTVEGTGGTAIILPDGALESGAVFKVEAFGPEKFPERPDFAGATFGGGLTITSEQMPTLKKEGDLVFRKPANAPDGAFYYIYRRLTGPNGQVAFETIDHAFPDGKGNVVTASYPFIGWKDSVVSWQAQADMSGIGFGLGAQTSFYLMYSWDSMMPGLATQGVVTGTVTRPVWKAGATEPEYQPVEGAMVQVLRENNHPIYPTIARSSADGTFSLWDQLYTGGTVDIEGGLGEDHATATAFEANVANTRTSAFGANLKYYGFAAHANLTFPVQTDTNVSGVDTHVMKLDANGKRQNAGGIIVAGTPLVIGFKFREGGSKPTIINANILGAELNVGPDTSSDALKMDYVLTEQYVPSQPGTYTITATALPPVGPLITISHTFLVIAQGGSNTKSISGAPDVVTDLIDPKPDSTGNPTSVFVQFAFTEPVKNVASSVHLVDPETGDVAMTISAIGVTPAGDEFVISDLKAQSADTAVTSITLQPISALKFGTNYSVVLDRAIVDLDKKADGTPDPQPLRDAPRTFHFTTLRPEVLGNAGQSFSGLGVVVLEDRAYAVDNGSPHGKLRVFDIGTDPATPTQIFETYMAGTPAYIAGEAASDVVGGGRIIAAPATMMVLSSPSNLWIYDATTDAPERIGAVSLTNSTQEGISLRVAVKGRYAYSWTYPLGIQIIDMLRAKQNYAAASADGATRQRMFTDLVTEGRGFGQDAIVNTIFVPGPTGGTAHIFGLKVADYLVDGMSQPMIVASGSLPLIVANPQTLQSWRFQTLTNNNSDSVNWGWSVALGRIAEKPVAVVVGKGGTKNGAGWVASAIDMTDPRTPKLMSSILLPEQPLDVALRGTLALVSTTSSIITVSLADPTKPAIAGTISNIGGRFVVTDTGLVVAVGGANNTLTTAALGSFALVHAILPLYPTLDANGKTEEPVEVEYQIVNPPANLKSAQLDVEEGSQAVTSVALTQLTPGVHRVTLPAGTAFKPSPETVDVTVKKPSGGASEKFTTSRAALQTGGEAAFCGKSNSDTQPIVAAAHIAPQHFGISTLSISALTPNAIAAGSRAVTVTLPQSYVADLDTIQVARLGGAWRPYALTADAALDKTFVIAADQIAQPGIVLISRDSEDPRLSLTLLVYDLSLPALQTSTTIVPLTADFIYPDEGVTLLRVTGLGFETGMRLVIGRTTTPGFVLPTTAVDINTLDGSLPTDALGNADDLFVAVLSADGTRLSAALPLTTFLSRYDEPEEYTRLEDPEASIGDAFKTDDVAITAMQPVAEGIVEMRGVGLTSGMEVTFTTTSDDGEVVTTTSTVENVQDIQPTLMAMRIGSVESSSESESQVQDPHPVKEKKGTVAVKLPPAKKQNMRVRGKSTTGQVVVTSPPAPFRPRDVMELPLGAQYPFTVYSHKEDGKDKLYILSPCEVDNALDKANWTARHDLAPSIEISQNPTTRVEMVTVPGQAPEVTLIPRLQKEKEADKSSTTEVDESKWTYLRGIGLSQDENLTRKLTPMIATVRVAGQSPEVTRKIAVVYRTLGQNSNAPAKKAGQSTTFDKIIAWEASKYGVPPDFLKAQVDQESVHFSKNYRYEPSTIDFKMYSGDCIDQESGRCISDGRTSSTAPINVSPFKFYAIGGKVLNPHQVTEKFNESPAAPKTSFELTKVPLKRRTGFRKWWSPGLADGKVIDPAVTASVYRVSDGRLLRELTLVSEDRIWRMYKYGQNNTEYSNGAVQFGTTMTPGSDQFVVNYRTGQLRTAKAIQAGERLHVEYYPLSAADAQRSVDVSTVAGGAPNINDPAVVKHTQQSLQYYVGQSLGYFFQTNVNSIGAGFLSGTHSDSQIAWICPACTADAAGKSGPPGARTLEDPKYEYVTAQYWASASYGPLQVTLPVWGDGDARGRILRSVYPINSDTYQTNTLYKLLVDDSKGVELGAAIHHGVRLDLLANRIRIGTGESPFLKPDIVCMPDSCNNEKWDKMWSVVFRQYNKGDWDFYGYENTLVNKQHTNVKPKLPQLLSRRNGFRPQ